MKFWDSFEALDKTSSFIKVTIIVIGATITLLGILQFTITKRISTIKNNPNLLSSSQIDSLRVNLLKKDVDFKDQLLIIIGPKHTYSITENSEDYTEKITTLFKSLGWNVVNEKVEAGKVPTNGIVIQSYSPQIQPINDLTVNMVYAFEISGLSANRQFNSDPNFDSTIVRFWVGLDPIHNK